MNEIAASKIQTIYWCGDNRSMLRLRLLNTIGAAIITLYAFLIDAWPMVLLNALLAGINGYHYVVLVREKSTENT